MNSEWFIIINPTSGNGKAKKYWPLIKNELNRVNIHFSFSFTSYAKHETELAQQAIKNGFTKLIIIGGDGTLHHVVNGIMQQKSVDSYSIQLAVIPIGTGNDWVKTYNIPKNYKKAIQIIKQGKTQAQDIGLLETRNTKTYFNNIAGTGYDAYVVSKLKKLKKLGGIAYLLSGIYSLLFYKKSNFKIELNGTEINTTCLMTIFGICQYSGGGMQITKDVVPNDGLLDITVAKNLNLWDLLTNLPKLYNGQIVYHKKVSTYKADRIQITPQNKETFIQADGELIAQGAVSVSICRDAIQFTIA